MSRRPGTPALREGRAGAPRHPRDKPEGRLFSLWQKRSRNFRRSADHSRDSTQIPFEEGWRRLQLGLAFWRGMLGYGNGKDGRVTVIPLASCEADIIHTSVVRNGGRLSSAL